MAPAKATSRSERKAFVVAAFIAAGVFITGCGAGMSSPAIGGLGVVIAVIGPGFVAVTGLRGGSKDLVQGEAVVLEVSGLPSSGTSGRCEFELSLRARGINGRPVRVRDPAVPVNKWPDVGDTLPVVIAARDPRQVRILWDQVPARGGIDIDADMYPNLDDYPDFEIDDDQAGPLGEIADIDGVLAALDAPDPRPDDDPTLGGLSPVSVAQRPSPRPRRPADEPAAAAGVPVRPEAAPGAPEADSASVLAPPAAPASTPASPPATPAATVPAQAVGPGAAGSQATTPQADPAPVEPAGAGGASVTLIVSNLDRSRRFYRDMLGLREIDHSETAAVLASGGARVVLRQVSDMSPVDRRLAHLNLDVSDVEEAYERLRTKGIEFVHRPKTVRQGEHLDLCSATFRDPDGHAVALTRWIMRP